MMPILIKHLINLAKILLNQIDNSRLKLLMNENPGCNDQIDSLGGWS